MHDALRHGGTHTSGEFVNHMTVRIIRYRMHSVQPQTVVMDLLNPPHGISNNEFAHGSTVRAVKVDASAPGGAMSLCKELRSIERQVVSLRPEMVIHNI